MSDHHEELRHLVDDVTAGLDMETRNGDGLWQTLEGLGLHLVGVDEEHGGSGGSFADLAMVVRALGEKAVGLPVGEQAVCAWALGAHGKAGGRAAVVFEDDPGAPWLRDVRRFVVYRYDGTAQVLDVGAHGVGVVPGTNLAGEPRDALTVADGVTGEPLPGAPEMDVVRARLALLRAAATVGAVDGVYALTRAYVTQREQFGKALARIPAVAGQLATMKVVAVQADAALHRAVDAIEASPGASAGAMSAVAVARVAAAEAAAVCARTAHQLHGAMGVTAEYPLHHWTKRLWAWPREYGGDGDAARHLGERALGGGERVVWEDLTA